MPNVDFNKLECHADFRMSDVNQFLATVSDMSGRKNKQCRVSENTPLWDLINTGLETPVNFSATNRLDPRNTCHGRDMKPGVKTELKRPGRNLN